MTIDDEKRMRKAMWENGHVAYIEACVRYAAEEYQISLSQRDVIIRTLTAGERTS